MKQINFYHFAVASFSIVTCVVMLFFISPLQVVADAPPASDQQHILQDTPNHVDTYHDNDCSQSAAISGTGLAAADALTKVGLDPQWQALIFKYAAAARADPVAMASLMFWEHRGFPPFGKAQSPNDSDSNGRGAWQITSSSWPGKDYATGVYDPDRSTQVAAGIVASYGGTATNHQLGSIKQDFSKGNKLASMASLAKNYNAGTGTYRNPGIADYNQPGRQWLKGAGAAWSGSKPQIIDDNVVGMTYVYYQIATGGPITLKDTNSYVQEALTKESAIESFSSTTSSTGSASPVDASASASTCTCPAPASTTPTTTAPAAPAAGTGQPVIVLDPGHSGKNNNVVDPATGLDDHDYPNTPEITDVFEVAQAIQAKLTADGYKVVLTKNAAMDTVTFRQRVNIAEQNNANLAVSIHTDGGQPFGKFAQVYTQKVGLWRSRIDGSKKLTFSDTNLANKDAIYGIVFTQQRAAAEGRAVQSTDVNFSNAGRASAGIDPGNLSMVQLWSTVPWIYNEVGGVGVNKQAYETGLINSIEKSVPVSAGAAAANNAAGTSNCGSGDGVVAGSIVQTALNLAWNDASKSYGKNKADAKPEYQAAKAEFNPKAVGDDEYSDCGVFVATVMHASGADPNYFYRGTGNQLAYLKQHPEKYQLFDNINSTADLKPGDILVFSASPYGHTYIYVGPQTGPGGAYNSTAASLHTHVPKATNAFFTENGHHFTVARMIS